MDDAKKDEKKPAPPQAGAAVKPPPNPAPAKAPSAAATASKDVPTQSITPVPATPAPAAAKAPATPASGQASGASSSPPPSSLGSKLEKAAALPPRVPPTTGPPPAPAPKTEAVVVAPAVVAPVAPVLPPARRGLQTLTETIAVILFLALTLIPAARLGIVRVSATNQINLLIVASVILIGAILLFLRAGYRARGSVEDAVATRRRDDAMLNALSVANSVVLFLIGIVEVFALLVFFQVVRSTSPLVVLVAGQFIPFVAFTLLFVDLLLIARTSFESRRKAKDWHRDVGYFLLAASGFVLVVTLLKNLNVLNAGVFAAIKPEQSVYLLSFATFLQLVAYKLLLRYPNLSQVFVNEIERARRANKEERLNLQKRAMRAYLVGLAFVVLSFVLIGGVTTGRVASGDAGTQNVILVTYVSFAVAILVLVLARFLQHRFLDERARRQERGEVIATKRRTKDEVADLVIYSASGFFALIAVIVATLTFMERTPLKASLGTDFLIIAFLVGVGPYGFKRGVDLNRIRAMDEKFPDFLRDLAEGLRAGMTLPRALKASSKGVYGALTPEIRTMSSQVEWGVSFPDALSRFSDRVKTPLIERTVSLVNEASKAGGNVIDILTAAAGDAREIKQIIEDRRRQMGIYSVIIYVAFFVFLVVIFVLAAQFLPSFQDAVKGASGQQVGGLAFAPFQTSTYVRLFFHAALIQGIGGGLVAGVMTEGHPVGGLKHSFIMTIIAWIFFRVLL